MATFSFPDARKVVVDQLLAARKLEKEEVSLSEASGRVLAELVTADRDYPPTTRSVRDGFAVRASDLPGSLEVIGEVSAGEVFAGEVRAGQCVEIMTGAPRPRGADAVLMVEFAKREDSRLTTDRSVRSGENFTPQGAEARQGMALLPAGFRIGFAQISLLAMVGKSRVQVYRRPRVAILSTGDELVSLEATPAPHQIRNSNAYSLAAQVDRAGGIPVIFPIVRDSQEETFSALEQALSYDLVLLSGGVSAGKYDFVEPALQEFNAEFFFDRVLIQPGQPLVFGKVQGKFFFGLPGNPGSTMVTFEVFARAAIEMLSGLQEPDLRMPRLRLTTAFSHKTGLTRFLPARVNGEATEVTPVQWQGSGDIAAVARANAFLVAQADRESWQAGEEIGVLFQ